MRLRRLVLPLAMAALVVGVASPGASAAGTWGWPVVGPVVRGFEPPSTPYGAGHRGIDIAAPVRTPIRAPAPGVVHFAGPVGGHLVVSIDHGGGLLSTYTWLASISVRRGGAVLAGTVLGSTSAGQPSSSLPHLDFGVKLNDEYVDPLTLLSAGSVVDLIRLAPIPAGG